MFQLSALSPPKAVDPTMARISHMPLCKHKVNSMEWEANSSSAEQRQTLGYKERLGQSQVQSHTWRSQPMAEERRSSAWPRIALPTFTGQSSCLKASSLSTYANNRTQNSKKKKKSGERNGSSTLWENVQFKTHTS